MGRIVKYKLPCINPDCGSSDALNVYEEGDSYCFSCKKFFTKAQTEAGTGENIGSISKASSIRISKPKPTFNVIQDLGAIQQLKSASLKDRKISKEVCEFFGVKVTVNAEGAVDAHYYPYNEGRGYKVRSLPKNFQIVGEAKGLFGRDRFQGAGKRVIVTEGEVDALSVAQASMDKYQKIYPVVSIPSASAVKVLIEHRDWLRSFQEVVLFLDSDEPGQKATKEAVRIIGYDKAKVVKIDEKDANEVLQKHGWSKVMDAIWDATMYVPSGIISKEDIWKALSEYSDKKSIPYPPCLHGINSKLKGMRGGEISLFISGTGSGKSTMLREVILHLLETTDSKIGVVSLEESPAETARNLSGMAIHRNPSDEEIPMEDLKVGFDKVFGSDRLVMLDHQGAVTDSTIIDQLEYMALVGCTHIMLDHITILVSEGADGLTGNEAIDKTMNDLLRLVKRYPDLWLGLVSHLRKAPGGKSFEEGYIPSIDDIKGSGSIKQISFDIIAFARNMTANEELERNMIQMSVLKCRKTGLTGPVAGAFYNRQTGRLTPLDEISDEDFGVLG